MKLNVVTPEGKVTAHLRHVCHIMVDIYDPVRPKVRILDAKGKKILTLEYATKEKAQQAVTACAETIRAYEALKGAMGATGDPVQMPTLQSFQLPTIVLEADNA